MERGRVGTNFKCLYKEVSVFIRMERTANFIPLASEAGENKLPVSKAGRNLDETNFLSVSPSCSRKQSHQSLGQDFPKKQDKSQGVSNLYGKARIWVYLLI